MDASRIVTTWKWAKGWVTPWGWLMFAVLTASLFFGGFLVALL